MVAAASAAVKLATNRRSAEIALTFASSRLRCTIPNSAFISSVLLGSRLSHPYSSHFSKLIFVPDQKNYLVFDYGMKKMISARPFLLEFVYGIYRRIHGPGQ